MYFINILQRGHTEVANLLMAKTVCYLQPNLLLWIHIFDMNIQEAFLSSKNFISSYIIHLPVLCFQLVDWAAINFPWNFLFAQMLSSCEISLTIKFCANIMAQI